MCEDAEDVAGHTSSGQDVEKLHRLHLEAVVAVDHEQDNVRDLGDVDHGLQLIGTLEEGKALLFRGDDRDGALGVGDRFLGVSADQRLEKSRLSDARRSDNGDEARRCLVRQSVDEGHMEALLFDLAGNEGGEHKIRALIGERGGQLTSCDLAAVRASLPGLAKAKALGFLSARWLSALGGSLEDRRKRVPPVCFAGFFSFDFRWGL